MKKNNYNKKISAYVLALIVSFQIGISGSYAITLEGAQAGGASSSRQFGIDNGIGVSSSTSTSSGGSGGGIGGAVAGGVTSCAANLVSQVAITALISGLGIKEEILGVPISQTSDVVGNAYRTGSTFSDDIKTLCLDPAARAIYKRMLLQTEQSIFNWANNGFKGGPLDGNTFVNDVEGYLGSVRLSAVETWISDQDKTNPFYDDIISAVYQNARNTNNGYTPDLAESILNAECQTYQAEQRKVSRNTNTSSGGGLSGLFNGIRGFFGGSDLPTNNPGFQNGGFRAPGSGVQLEGGLFNGPSSFNINPFKTDKALAQSRAPVPISDELEGIPGSANINTSNPVRATTDREDILRNGGSYYDEEAGEIVVVGTPSRGSAGGTPCNRSVSTAAEKQALIEAYNAGQVAVTPQSRWALLTKSLQCQNRVDCATRIALNSQESRAASAQNTENTTLSLNNGNTGVRTCVAFLPQTEGSTDRQCRSDGWRTVTPGSLVANQVVSALEVPLENVNKLTGQGTFADIAQSVLNSLINGLTSQLINSTNGLLSFSGGGGNSSSAGEFTRGVAALANTRTSTSDVQTSITRTSNYVSTLEENSSALSSIVDSTEKARTLCSQILPLVQTQTGVRGIFETSTANHRCNIDPLTLNYKDDPTAGIRLAQNTIYKEVSALDGTRGARDQARISLQNASGTLSSLRRVQSAYNASTDANRESTFASELATLTVSIPQEDAISLARSQSTELTTRKSQIARVVSELEAELAELKP